MWIYNGGGKLSNTLWCHISRDQLVDSLRVEVGNSAHFGFVSIFYLTAVLMPCVYVFYPLPQLLTWFWTTLGGPAIYTEQDTGSIPKPCKFNEGIPHKAGQIWSNTIGKLNKSLHKYYNSWIQILCCLPADILLIGFINSKICQLGLTRAMEQADVAMYSQSTVTSNVDQSTIILTGADQHV